jgi:hypothetical protein
MLVGDLADSRWGVKAGQAIGWRVDLGVGRGGQYGRFSFQIGRRNPCGIRTNVLYCFYDFR